MTVSNAYNRPDQIAPATRARVLAEAARLGYPGPHPTARSLRRRRAGAVGMLYAGPLSYAFSDPAAVLFLQGVSLATEAARLGLLLLSGSAADGRPSWPRRPSTALSPCPGRRRPPAGGGAGAAAAARAGGSGTQPGVTTWDRRRGQRSGRRRASAGAGTPALGYYRPGRGAGPRQGGARRDAQSRGARPPPWVCGGPGSRGRALATVPVYECATLTLAEGAGAATWLLSRDPRPTALLTMSDEFAFGVLDTARALGLACPRPLGGGLRRCPRGSTGEPPLTTVRQPHTEKGQRAAHLLLDSMRGPASDGPRDISLPTELIVRRSTARPRGS